MSVIVEQSCPSTEVIRYSCCPRTTSLRTRKKQEELRKMERAELIETIAEAKQDAGL